MILLRFFRWLCGYVEFCFEAGFCEGFINEAYEKGIKIYSLEKRGGRLYGKAGAGSYRRLHAVALRHGGKIKIIKKHGLVFATGKFRKRTGLAIGAFIFIFLLSFLSGFIWNIEVTGCEKLTGAQIISFLNANGFKSGVRWKNVNRDNLEFSMLSQFDEIAWVHINRRGSRALVEISEAAPKPEITNDSSASNVTARKDGIIVKVSAKKGWQCVNEGDAVTQGDLLISGIYYSEVDKKNHFVSANGEVLAKCVEKIEFTIKRTQDIKKTESKKRVRTFLLFGLEIPLYLPQKTGVNVEKSDSFKYLKLNKNALPIGIKTTVISTYSNSSEEVSDGVLKKQAEKKLARLKESQLSGYEILSEKTKLEINSEGISSSTTLNCIENIEKINKISGVDAENEP